MMVRLQLRTYSARCFVTAPRPLHANFLPVSVVGHIVAASLRRSVVVLLRCPWPRAKLTVGTSLLTRAGFAHSRDGDDGCGGLPSEKISMLTDTFRGARLHVCSIWATQHEEGKKNGHSHTTMQKSSVRLEQGTWL